MDEPSTYRCYKANLKGELGMERNSPTAICCGFSIVWVRCGYWEDGAWEGVASGASANSRIVTEIGSDLKQESDVSSPGLPPYPDEARV